LGSTSGLSVGQVLILDQANDAADPGIGSAFVNDSLTYSSEGGAPGRNVGGADYSQQEYKLVTAINGNVVTISPGLYMANWRSSQNPGAWWANSLIQLAGIESLTLDHSGSTNLTGVAFFNAYKSWMKNVRSIYFQNSNGGGRNHVWVQYSARITVRDSYFFGTRDAASLSYGVEPWQSADLLVENNLFQHIVAPLLIGGTHGSVFSYNYSLDHYFASSASWNMPGPSFTHDAGVAMNLFEGNQGTGMLEDAIHGTHNLHTYFRNQWSGRDPGKTAQTTPSSIAAYSRYMNVIGNVLGEAGYHTNYQALAPISTNCNASIFVLGFADGNCSASFVDPTVALTLMRWGNYDVVNNVVRFIAGEIPASLAQLANPVPASQVLPPSFYLAARPSAWWVTPWGTPPWPAVGPDVTGGNVTSGSGAASTLGGHAYKIPARLCYEHSSIDSAYGTNGVVLFDAANCYSGQLQAAPSPPTSLGVQ
jgi:hypothetical protein